MNSTDTKGELHWYAARLISGKDLISKRLASDAIHCYRTKYAPNILFVCCKAAYTRELIQDFRGRLYFYRDPGQTSPQSIPEREMNNFILVTSVSDEIINLGTVTPDFLVGQKVRVKGGLFLGAEGVIKRIKGDRRLIVSIDGVTAVATCFIRPELLEPVE